MPPATTYIRVGVRKPSSMGVASGEDSEIPKFDSLLRKKSAFLPLQVNEDFLAHILHQGRAAGNMMIEASDGHFLDLKSTSHVDQVRFDQSC